MARYQSGNFRYKSTLCVSLVLLLVIVFLPLAGYIGTGFAANQPEAESVNPRSVFWRKVREQDAGYSAVKGPESNVLIQGAGQNWRQLRNGPIASYGSGLLIGMLLVLLLFYGVVGRLKLNRPRTGQTVLRWSLAARCLHWLTTILFLILTVTGLSLLYGRAVLIPLFGHQGFAAYAEIAKLSHNLVGPMFMLGLFIMIVSWFKQNLFNRIDWQWFKAYGGMVGGKHPSAERLNGGEKIWFWVLAGAGTALCLSGLVLDFPNFNQQRDVMQIAHLIHVSTGLILIAFALGHTYIGSVGTEGALEGMVTGKVDTAWAEQHHDLWLEDIKQQERSSEPD